MDICQSSALIIYHDREERERKSSVVLIWMLGQCSAAIQQHTAALQHQLISHLNSNYSYISEGWYMFRLRR